MSISSIRRHLDQDKAGSATIRGMRHKITGVAMVAVVAVLALVVAGMNVLNWNNMCGRVDAVMDYVEDTDGDLAQLDYDVDEHPEMSGWAYEDLLEMQYDTRYFTVELDGDGDVVDSNMNSIVSVSSEKAAEMARDVHDGGRQRGFEGSYRYRVVPADHGSRIFFLYSYAELRAFRSFLRASVIMGLIGVLAFVAVVVPFSRTATRPVEEAQERQRRFVTDAGHELRTPISIIQSAADVIEIEGGESEWTESIHHQTERLESLTDKLVALAKADEAGRSLELSDVDLSEMALQVAEDFEPVAQAKARPLTTDIAEGAWCRADAGMLEQALSILLDNAFKHSSEGSEVRFAVGIRGAGGSRPRAWIRVTNDADDVPAGDHPEFFRRFYKADRSRAYGKDGGHGIGLAIVKAVIEAQGGSVSATSDGRQVTLAVELAGANAPAAGTDEAAGDHAGAEGSL